MRRSKADVIIIGTGMGGMTAGALLAKSGYKVLLLEAAHVPGGCSSSFYRKGYTFESGATTLIGFDEHQPLRYLEDEIGIRLPKRELTPSMSVWLNNQDAPLIRHKNLQDWIIEVSARFGNPNDQKEFWTLAKEISDVVWRVSLKNPLFPPQKLRDWLSLISGNDPRDLWILPYALKTTEQVLERYNLNTTAFRRFIDQQLMITAQATAKETPFLLGAAGLTYTNYSNYYVDGGLLKMVREIQDYIEQQGGELLVRHPVVDITQGASAYGVSAPKGRFYAPIVISNIPIWNLKAITHGSMQHHFEQESNRFNKSVGALTFGVAMDDIFPKEVTLHHQIHIPEDEIPAGMSSSSLFVSLSHADDRERAPQGERVLNISTHADPTCWNQLDADYELKKDVVTTRVLSLLDRYWEPFDKDKINTYYSATPVTWENWVYRYQGRVGGIPQWKGRRITDWPTNDPPFDGFYLCGDTVYPGQGIPGVTLSGINVYRRIKHQYS